MYRVMVVCCILLMVMGIVTAPALAQGSGVKFSGRVEALPQGTLIGLWTVEARRVVVTASTELDQERGPVGVGSCVDVEGTQNADGSVAASSIEVRSGQGGCRGRGNDDDSSEVEFRGVVQGLPPGGGAGLWLVSGRGVQVTASTKIEPRGNLPQVFDCVDVKGTLGAAQVVLAERIQRVGEGVCQHPPESRDEPKLVGTVQALPASGLIGNWRVGTQDVRVSADTRIEMERGVIQVGSCVTVRGVLQGSVLAARRIESEEAAECARAQGGQYEFMGVIEAIPVGGRTGDWRISGRTVTVNAATVLDTQHGLLVMGACVEVRGTLQASGVVVASRMEVQSASGACIFRNGVVNAGSFSSFAVSVGQIVSIFGMNIGPATRLPLEVGADGRVSSRLANTRVLFNGVAAPLLLASEGQINAVAPCALAGQTSALVQVESNGAWSNALTVPVVAAFPSIFTLSNSGRGPGAILNFEAATGGYSVNDLRNPVARNGIAVIYATGFGATDVACSDGLVVDPRLPLPRPLLPVGVTIGGRAATDIRYAGAAPGLVRGVFQVNVVVPADVEPGPSAPVFVTVGGKSSQDGVTMAVK